MHRLVVLDSAGTADIYDGVDDTGILIAEIDLTISTLEFGLPFSDGLYIETSNLTKATIIYE